MILTSSTHPDFLFMMHEWEKFRYIYEGGDWFIKKYLKKFTEREKAEAFELRKAITPTPSFSSAAVTDVKNAIFQRMVDISRVGGPETYQQAVVGRMGGVDLNGSTMNNYIGQEVLPELLFMGKVGLYVDMPQLGSDLNINQTRNVHPYVYKYQTEHIRNWTLHREHDSVEFDALLLHEWYMKLDENGLPASRAERYRLLRREDGVVTVRFFDTSEGQVDLDGQPSTEPYVLGIKRIPFVLFELNQSLLHDTANHQIALLNMESSDVNYSLLANYPFYTEQADNKFQSGYLKGAEDGKEGESKEIEVGATQGRQYGKGLDRPDFIHPSPEPLKASMEKQKNLKDDIRTLINLALSNTRPRYASAESKELDERGLESGLSYIGLVLEQGERQIASLWSDYEGTEQVADVHYPERYSLRSDADRREEASKLKDLQLVVPSHTYQKEISKKIADILLGTTVTSERLEEIHREIEEAKYITSDPDIIHGDVEKGLVSNDLASIARGYPEGEAEKAAIDHAERTKRIAMAQATVNSDAGARGVSDNSGDPDAGKKEKEASQNPDLDPDSEKKVRGEAK